MKYGLHCRIRPLLCQTHASTFVYRPILMKICINANIMKTQYLHRIIYDLKCYFHVMKKDCAFSTLRPSDLITTLTYVLMDNLCPCLVKFSTSLKFLKLERMGSLNKKGFKKFNFKIHTWELYLLKFLLGRGYIRPINFTVHIRTTSSYNWTTFVFFN